MSNPDNISVLSRQRKVASLEWGNSRWKPVRPFRISLALTSTPNDTWLIQSRKTDVSSFHPTLHWIRVNVDSFRFCARLFAFSVGNLSTLLGRRQVNSRKIDSEKAFLACIYRHWFPRLSSKLLLIPGCLRWHRVSSAYCMTSRERERKRGEPERVFFLTYTVGETTFVICISSTPRVWWHPTQKRSVSFPC